MVKMNIIDFANKYNLNWQPIELIITKSQTKENRWDKTPNMNITKALQNDFRNGITQEELLERKKIKASHVAIHTDTNLFVIDVDFKDEEEYSEESLEYVESLKKILPYKKSNTLKRGYHFYARNKNQILQHIMKHTPYPDIEILAGQWAWEHRDSNIKNVGDEIPFYEIPNIKNNENIKMNVEKLEYPNTDPIVVEMILNLPVERVWDYKEWFKTLVWIKKTYGESYKKVADELSQKAEDKYGKFDETWNSIKVSKVNNNLPDTVCPAIDFYNIFGKNVVVNNYEGKNEIYCYCDKSKLWKRDNKLSLIKFHLGKILNEKYATDLINETNENIRKLKINILQFKLNSNNWRQDVATTFIGEVLGNQECNIDFDSIDYLYHFKNTTFDLRTLTFRDRLKEDYCSMYACHLNERDDDKVKLWDEIINSIFTDSYVKKTYLDIIINSFSGVVLQKFIVFNGSGSNGKGMLDNCFKFLHNDYYYKGACSDLCLPNKGGSNPSLANCDKKRFCVYTEPNERDKLQVSTIKDMTGEDTINARKNYSNNTETKMGGIKIIECNKRCKLEGDTGYSIERRLIDLLFNSTFKTKDGISSFDTPYDKENNPTGYHEANTLYETNEWRQEHCSDLFYYLLDYMKENNKTYYNLSSFIVCDSVKDRTKEYIHDNNTFLEFIHNYCEKSKEDYVQVKDIIDAIKDDYEAWSLLSKKEKREMTVPKLCKRLQEDPQLCGYFKKRKKVDNKDLYNVLLHYKLKNNREMEDEDEDED
jgi:phage/plasmid-associated DNA primase